MAKITIWSTKIRVFIHILVRLLKKEHAFGVEEDIEAKEISMKTTQINACFI